MMWGFHDPSKPQPTVTRTIQGPELAYCMEFWRRAAMDAPTAPCSPYTFDAALRQAIAMRLAQSPGAGYQQALGGYNQIARPDSAAVLSVAEAFHKFLMGEDK